MYLQPHYGHKAHIGNQQLLKHCMQHSMKSAQVYYYNRFFHQKPGMLSQVIQYYSQTRSSVPVANEPMNSFTEK